MLPLSSNPIDGPIDERQLSGEIRLRYYTADAFKREAPPGDLGSSELWTFAAEFIDMCSAVFVQHNAVRKDHETRDLVLAALLRRALVITESVFSLSYNGLPEGAVGLVRTLLDIELNARLVAADSTDRTAKRYAAYHYFIGRRHGQKMSSDRATRSMLQRYEGAFEEVLDALRRHEEWFQTPGFAEVRDEIDATRPWHGFNRAEEAFKSVGMSTDYHQTYDIGTFFVHATNIDFDFHSIVDGRVMLKPPQTRDEAQLLPTLGTALGHLYKILEVFASDKAIQLEDGVLVVEGHEEPVGAVDAMGIMLGQVLSKYSLPEVDTSDETGEDNAPPLMSNTR
jgi:hypothetical protein